MKKIVLISCVSRKGKLKAKAKDLYKGPLFKNSLEYARALNPDHIFILSAKYYLLDLDAEIEPYDVTLSYVSPNKMINKPNLKVLTKEETVEWGKKVLEQLGKIADLTNDEFIFLAGQSYLSPIASDLKKIKEPLKGIIQGKRPSILKHLISEINGR